MTCPEGLQAGGETLWRAVTEQHELDLVQLVTLEFACRQRDRADSRVAAAASGDIAAVRMERDAIRAMTQLLAALRLPDASGRRPPRRPWRGVYRL